MIHSFRDTVRLWVNQSIRGDLYLRPAMADINRYRDPLPEEVVSRLRALPDGTDVLPYRRLFLRCGSIPYQFEPLDFSTLFRHANLLLMDANLDDILPRLIAGEGVVVSEVFANQTGLTTGKRLQATIEATDFDLPILGVFRDYRTQGGGVVHYSLPHFQERTGDVSWGGVSIYFQGPESKREADAVRLRGEILNEFPPTRYALQMTPGNDLRNAILRIFDETFAVTSVLLLIALIVAALGITTTLTVLVLERARQMHTITATGGAPGQIRAMIFWEATLMTLVGEAVGLGCGFVLSHILVFVINRQSFGWTFIYSVDWFALAMSLPLILLTALLSAIPAGQLVFRQSPALLLRER
jgi:putative ABC transport system permease protein